MRAGALVAVALGCVWCAAVRPQAAAASGSGWTAPFEAAVRRLGLASDRPSGTALDHAAARLGAFPAAAKFDALAAVVGHEGHWTFRNRSGETFTAATPAELARVASVLAPSAAGSDAKLALVLGTQTVFEHRARLDDLPRGAALYLAIASKTHPLVRRRDSSGVRLLAEVGAGLLVEIGPRALFDEALWQLARPLPAARIRLLTLEPGGPHTFAPSPRIDPARGSIAADTIDPFKLTAALKGLSRQTAVITGRKDGTYLRIQPASGDEITLIWADIAAAAAAADVNLILLQATSTRQPGSRNWLWQRIEVAGLGEALQRATVADFLAALAAGRDRFSVSARSAGAGRIALSAIAERGVAAEPASGGVGGLVSDMLSELAGKVVSGSIEADLVDRARSEELGRRILPAVPSAIQLGYGGTLLLGLLGLPVARRWWRRVWPPERRADYAGAGGYHAARLAKLAAFALIFMPLVAVLSTPLTIVTGAWVRGRRAATPPAEAANVP